MQVAVTGAAGFVGSHLTEALLRQGHRVTGIDCFTDYYDPAAKVDNIKPAAASNRFKLVNADLRTADLEELLDGCQVVWHQAGQPGVRRSWADGFGEYATHNVLATQRVLEAALRCGVSRVVYASSSSVYGNAGSYPTSELNLPRPYSPYGVTKLAAEHLCTLYAANYGLSTVSLRYFTVYGPRQRPDMAIRRLAEAAVSGGCFSLFGSGSQIRDFTYVGDVVRANLLAGEADAAPGTVLNVAGGSHVSVNDVIDLMSQLTGRRLLVERIDSQRGDVFRTGGSTELAHEVLGWAPQTELRDGLAHTLEWAESNLANCAWEPAVAV